MGGGSVAIRGYLVQTLVALLEALEDQTWTAVTLEPEHTSEKIDILWHYPGRTKAVQVKSSINPFEDPDVKRWAKDLEDSRGADTYELILVGVASKPAVAKARRLGKVDVPSPQNLNLPASRRQIAQLLDVFMEVNSLPRGSARYREMLADALVGQAATLSIQAQPLTRDDLIQLLKTWVEEARKVVSLFPIFQCPPKNPWFTGREKELAEVHQCLSNGGRAAIGQAIRGLGGIGKTQTAIEFCHRHRDQYDAVFWVGAASALDLMTGYGKIAEHLKLPHDPSNPDSILAVVLRWCESDDGRRWLFVFDNADDPPLLAPYLPSRAPQGHILVTSRVRLDVLGIREALSMERLPEDDAVQFLLDRAKRLPADEPEQQAARALAHELDGLPLALEQAAAYAVAMQVTYGQYLESYRTRKLELLERQGPELGNYPTSVATTWLLNFEQVKAASPAAADLLRLSAMLDPDDIPFELLTEGASHLGQPLAEAVRASDPLSVNEVLEPLARFSLIDIDGEARTYSVHRLVQEVVKDVMGAETRRTWAERAIEALNAAFPSVNIETWPACERLIPHAIVAGGLAKTHEVQSNSAGWLLNQAAYYLHDRGQFGLAEPLFRQALEIRREVLGEQHPNFATSLNNLAGLYNVTGRYAEAEPLYRQALEIRRQVLGEKHPQFATSLNNLALLYRETGRHADAEPLYRQALEILLNVFGPEHPNTKTCQANFDILRRELDSPPDT